MLKKFLLVLLTVSGMTFAAGTEDKVNAVGGWAQGGNAGEHFGLDYEMRLDPIVTLDIYLHFYLSKNDNSIGAYLGYYWNHYIIPIPPDAGRMGLYWGPAGGIGWWGNDDENGLAFRLGVVGGWEWEFPQQIPLELYLELNPVGEFHCMWHNDADKNDTDWRLPDVYLRIGLRFWF